MWGDSSLWFWFAFLWWLAMLSIFSCACYSSVCPLWQNVYSGLLLIFWGFFGFLMLSCMSCLYILDINSLTVISLANIFSHSVGCLFILWKVSFAMQKLLSLIRSHLFIFASVFFCLRRQIQIISLWLMSECSACVFYPFHSGTPIMRMLVFLMLSHRSFKMFSFFKICFSLAVLFGWFLFYLPDHLGILLYHLVCC